MSNQLQKLLYGNKPKIRKPIKKTKLDKSWALHVRLAFKKYSRRRVNKRRKRQHKEMFRRVKRSKYLLNLRQSKNNFFSTLITKSRKVLWGLSIGTIGLVGPKRRTLFGAQQLGRYTTKAMERTKTLRPLLILKSPLNSNMRGCLHNLNKKRGGIRALIDLIPRPHNGVRPKKLRRV